MSIEAEWLLALIAFPVIGYFFRTFTNTLTNHDNRMDQMEKDLVNKEEWQRELDRTNKIIGELYNNKADKELLQALNKPTTG